MNWGKGITIALVLFMGFIIFLTSYMMSRNVDLDNENYYIREIAYEEEITAMKNAGKQERIELTDNETHLIVKLPETGNYEDVQLDLMRPNDDKGDRSFSLRDSRTLTIDKKELEKGSYRVEISYRNGKDNCLQKEEIYL